VGAGAPDASVKDLGLELSGIQLRSLGAATPLFELASLGLVQGQLDLAGQTLSLDRVSASGGRMTATRDALGRIAVLDALARKPTARKTAPGKPWHYKVGTLAANDFELGLREESVSPAASLDLARLRLEARGLSDDAKASVPLSMSFNARQGGRFEASGWMQPATQNADIRFKLSELSLLPAQPYVAQKSSLLLASGQASMQGRFLLQQGKPKVEAGFAIKNLLLNEAQTRERFLGWTLLSGRQLVATPQQVDLNELSLDGLGAKLIIFKDRSTNVAKLLKPDDALALAQPAEPSQAASAPPLQFSLGRARISNSNMEFADLSLALPFGARIHELNGFLTGVSSRPEALTQIELNGKVDEFGLARAVGQIKPLAPPDFTDLRVIFRNVEMTSLTPYSATFAGRKIESGKLSLELEYKVKQRQLLGDNKVIMDQLTLGERVDSPGAMSLPLDLALAILRDADGKVDLGLPVSGSLDDPQFSYGQLVWKALVNVLGKIATAPFRALGALLGIEADKLDKIVFDAGSVELLPPEREKLLNLSRLLAQRAGLVLAVHGDYSPQLDGEAIKSLRLRRAVALQSGRSLAEGEDPGPIALAQPATRVALEKLYAGRLGGAALQALKQRHAQANPEATPASATGRLVAGLTSAFKPSPKPLSAQESAQLRGADLHGLLAQALLAADTVDEAALQQIGAARAAAIQRELAGRGVTAERVRLAEPRTQVGDGNAVTVEIGLGAPARP